MATAIFGLLNGCGSSDGGSQPPPLQKGINTSLQLLQNVKVDQAQNLPCTISSGGITLAYPAVKQTTVVNYVFILMEANLATVQTWNASQKANVFADCVAPFIEKHVSEATK